ncbi:hypothetical protein Afil01_59860 [Actinorhabdospora filicis]|uniref:Uncharacterized protein n=1 Tax=Actinorhabdospora filicis TaxID=1785913 RepID=A0A9W6SQP1_9ACTN|nr:hypothetical protein [Actinorhabdospora filicis]GLZ81179.1 hypothetical protein Afil01_59860 [Actinorhabdospora filicis]
MNHMGRGPDDMGDDEQETDTSEWERFIEDPPEDMVIRAEPDGGEIGITEWMPMETRPGDARREAEEADPRSAEEAAEHVIGE